MGSIFPNKDVIGVLKNSGTFVYENSSLNWCTSDIDSGCIIPYVHGYYDGNGACISCSGAPNTWKNICMQSTTNELLISGPCTAPYAPGIVKWQELAQFAYTTNMELNGMTSTLQGPCPLINTGENMYIHDITIICTSGKYAIRITNKNVRIEDVTVINASLFYSDGVTNDVTGLSISRCTSGTDYLGSITNALCNKVYLFCVTPYIVLFNSGATGKLQNAVKNTGCIVNNIYEQMQYVDYSHRANYESEETSLFNADLWELNAILAIIAILLICLVLYVRQGNPYHAMRAAMLS